MDCIDVEAWLSLVRQRWTGRAECRRTWLEFGPVCGTNSDSWRSGLEAAADAGSAGVVGLWSAQRTSRFDLMLEPLCRADGGEGWRPAKRDSRAGVTGGANSVGVHIEASAVLDSGPDAPEPDNDYLRLNGALLRI
jgi:hypothetical protein